MKGPNKAIEGYRKALLLTLAAAYSNHLCSDQLAAVFTFHNQLTLSYSLSAVYGSRESRPPYGGWVALLGGKKLVIRYHRFLLWMF